MAADLLYTIRSLRQSPWYSATVVGVIALTMALATTVFAVVDGVLFKPLPYPDAGRLFQIRPGFSDLVPTFPPSASAVDVANWQAAAPEAAITAVNVAPWIGLGQKANEGPIGVGGIQRNFFDVLGVRPLVGGFTDSDFDQRQLIWPVVITHEYWQGHFDGDPTVVGRQIIADAVRGSGYRIVGIMPKGFVFPTGRWTVNLITPYLDHREDARNPAVRIFTDVFLRAPTGLPVPVLQSKVDAGTARTASAFPPRGAKPPGASDRGWRQAGSYDRSELEPVASSLGRRDRPFFLAVFLGACVLVTIGALNVSGLMAARCLDRERELGLRRLLGADGWVVARLVFTESLMLLSIGSALGLSLAAPLLRLGLHLLPEELVPLKAIAIDWRVAEFVVLSLIVVSSLAAVWPIARAWRTHGPTAEPGRSTERARSAGRVAVVSVQVAGALALAVVGALLVGSIMSVYAHAQPIRTDRVLVVEGRLLDRGGIAEKRPERTARVSALLEQFRAIAGVEHVAVTGAELLQGGSWPSWFRQPEHALKNRLQVDVQAVSPDFYRIVQPQVVAGRLPSESELASNARVIVVSETIARTYWPGESALGQPLTEWATHDQLGETYTVIGVAKDVRWFGWDMDTASIYGSYALLARAPFPTFLLEVSGNTGRVLAEAQRALEKTDPLVQPLRAAALADLFADSVRPRRFQSWLFGSFAGAALVVVGVGLLGLLAMATSRRTREFGIRYALGARPRRLIGLILGEQLLAVAIGLAAGLAISAWAVRFLGSYLYEITIYDPRVWAAAVFTVLTSTTIGILVPSIRASRVNPIEALRVD